MQKQANLAQLIETLRRQLPLLAERYQVESLGVFGSYVRHEQRSDSDLDVLVTFHDPPSRLKLSWSTIGCVGGQDRLGYER